MSSSPKDTRICQCYLEQAQVLERQSPAHELIMGLILGVALPIGIFSTLADPPPVGIFLLFLIVFGSVTTLGFYCQTRYIVNRLRKLANNELIDKHRIRKYFRLRQHFFKLERNEGFEGKGFDSRYALGDVYYSGNEITRRAIDKRINSGA